MYKLTLKGDKTKEAIDKISSDSLQNAINFFMARKQMNKETIKRVIVLFIKNVFFVIKQSCKKY